ncbi:hypothetical protein MD588_06625 [Photobacterium sp. SDRW27]|uniref:alpha/beta hydrolase n=1 Tax=Photobacterium obscurum TaxID=2829490 RepID=UPI0022438DEA|nr:hypothetical protein [Photobacterium obscurum]MCW8328481.1 hypothetical protein [Photobacterium obscurum]
MALGLITGDKIVRLVWWTGLKKVASTFHAKLLKPEQFVHEFLTDLAKIGSLKKVLGEKPLEPFGADNSELSERYYTSKKNYSQAIRSFFIDPTPFIKETKITPLLPAESFHNNNPTPNETWFFLNGIGTNEDMAKVNAQMLSKIFKRPITPLHNPTNGFKHDLIEVMKGRTFDQNTSIAKTTRDHIRRELKKMAVKLESADEDVKSTYKVVVIAHSQGGVIISNVVRMLIQDPSCNSLLDHLEVYTFASAHDEYPSPWAVKDEQKVPFTEHFANDNDYIAEVGVLNSVGKTAGKVYVKGGAGHLLNYHYLRDFDEGKYEGHSGSGSRLHTLRGGNR